MSRSKKTSKSSRNKIISSLIGLITIIILLLLGYNSDIVNKEINKNTNVNEIQQEIEQKIDFVSEEELKVYFIDVGQADSILITQKNQSMLIDAGNNEDGPDVVNFIKEKGINKLNYVIGTHPHEDHIGGLDDVINSDIEIESILMPKIQTNTKTFESVLDAVLNKGLKVTAPKKGDTFDIGEANCEVMTDSILDEKNLNLSSITIKLTFGNNSFLFMGDSESKNETTREWPKVDVLKVGHHGSNTSSSQKFLEQVQPKYSIIMVGKDNSYGLPKENILKRLKNIGSEIYRTDEMGTIEITSDGNSLQVIVESVNV